jgi:TatD DNase family protein
MVTYTNKTLDSLRDVAARAPLDRLLVETDCPYLSPHPFRGKTNEPSRVGWTALRIAQVRAMNPSELANATSANARRLFRLDGDDRL